MKSERPHAQRLDLPRERIQIRGHGRYFSKALVILTAAISACAPVALVRTGPSRPAHPVRRLALAPISDYPGARGSGPLAAAALSRALARAGYCVTPRWDQADAVAYADLTDFSEALPQDVRVFSPPVLIDLSLALRSPAAAFTWVAKWASARVGLRVRVVDAATGQEVALAWAASRPDRFQSALDYTYHLTAGAAADQASDALVGALGPGLAPGEHRL